MNEDMNNQMNNEGQYVTNQQNYGGQQNFSQQGYGNVTPPEKKGLSIASMVLGICGFVAWCVPLIGYPVTITGLVLGIIGIKKGGRNMAIAGIITSAITLLLTLGNSILAVILNAGGYYYF